jgi:hypothetical protein
MNIARSTLMAIVAFGVAVAMTTAGSQAAPVPAEFIDPTGDAGAGPDITNVTVSADDAGLITFRIAMPNRPTLGPAHETHIYIDSDQSMATSFSSGADLLLWSDATGFGMVRWNGSTFADPTRPGSLTFGYSDGAASFTINRADLPPTADPLRFWIGTTDNIDDPANFDPAPEIGVFTYEFSEAVAIDSVVVPAPILHPRAGRVVSAHGVRLRLSTDEVVKPDRLTCTLKLAGRTLPPMAGGCKWRVPPSAAGKRGALVVTLSYGGETMTERYSLRIRR